MFTKSLSVLLAAVYLGITAASGAWAAQVIEPNGTVINGKVTIIVKKGHRKPRKHRHKHVKRKHTVTLHNTTAAPARPAPPPVRAL
jgi:hypothetical protein